MFVYKHAETLQDVKKYPIFLKKLQTLPVNHWMQNFQGIVFIWTRTYSEIFRSALVCF